MDKNTLSHYGWIIIAIIIITLLLGFAIPFAVSIRDGTHDVAGEYLSPDTSKDEVAGGVSISSGVPIHIGDSHATSFDYVIGEGVFDTVKVYQNGKLLETFENTKTSGDNVYSFNEGDFVYGDAIKVELYREGVLVGVDTDIYDYTTTANYIVTINKEGGIKTATLSGYFSVNNGKYVYIGNSQVTATATLERGYEFVGWYDSEDNLLSTDEVYKFTVVTNVNLTAKAKLAEYNINYETNGGILSADVITTYTVLDTVALPVPSKDDCLFDGWYETSNFSGSPVTSITDEVGDKTYYAKWIPNNLDVIAKGYSGVYDGNAHGISVTCKDATISYSVDGVNFRAENYTYTDAGVYMIHYKVEKNGHSPVVGFEYVNISKADGWVVLSSHEGILVYPSAGSFQVTDSHPGGELSVETTNASIATATINGNRIALVPGVAGKTIITVTSAETVNYKSASATYTVTVKTGELNVTANGYKGVYDGKPHSISVTCSGATITYSTDGSNYSGVNPTYVNAGNYTVYYKVEKSGYDAVTDSQKVIIDKAPGSIKLSSYEDSASPHGIYMVEIIENLSGGPVSITTLNTDVGVASLNGNTITFFANDVEGVAKFTITSGETQNYKAASVTHTMSVTISYLDFESYGYTGVYDGDAHSITVDCPDATIQYSEDGELYSENNPEYTDVGEYTVYYIITRSGYETVYGSETVVIEKAEGKVVLSPTSGTLSYDDSLTVEVIENRSGGELSIETSNGDVATAVLDGTTATITSGTTRGTITITITSAATQNYKEASATYELTVSPSALVIFAEGYEGVYDGQPHSITVTCDGATIYYSTTGDADYTVDNPTYTDVGEYTVHYAITKSGYETVYGFETVIIKKADGKVTLSPTSGTLSYNDSSIVEVIENLSGGELSITVQNSDIAAAVIDGTTATITSKITQGTTTITITSATTRNYNEASATYQLTVAPNALVVSAEGYEGIYDGLPHSITVTCDGATISYFDNTTLSYTSENPSYTNAGTYTVRYKVEKDGYDTILGNETVIIHKAPGSVTLSETVGALTYPDSAQFTITENLSGGELSVSTENAKIATGEIDGISVTVVPGTTAGTVIITVTSAETDNFTEASATYTAIVGKGSLSVSAEGYIGVYDGDSHNITVSCSGATIFYSTTGNGDYSAVNPAYTNAGEYTVYYAVTKSGYETVYGSETVIIEKADGYVELSPTSGSVSYSESTTFEIVENLSGGELTVASRNNSIAAAEMDGTIVTVTSKTTTGIVTITVTSAETQNYKSASANYTLTVNAPATQEPLALILNNTSDPSDKYPMVFIVAEPISVGDTYNGLEVLHVYSGFTTGDTIPWSAQRYMVTSVMFEDVIAPECVESWFFEFTSCSSFDVANLDVSNVESLRYTFYSAGSSASVSEFTITGLSSWKTNNVTDMCGVFRESGYNATSWEIDDISSWKTGLVTDMSGMFQEAACHATSFRLDVTNWNVSSVTDMSSMFNFTGRYNCETWVLTGLDTWDTSSVQDLSYFINSAGFYAQEAIIDISGWNVSNVRFFDYAFDSFGFKAGSASLGYIDNWTICTDDYVSMSHMFRYTAKRAGSFDTLDLTGWDVSTVSQYEHFCHEANWESVKIIPPLDTYGHCPAYSKCDCVSCGDADCLIPKED